MYNHHMAAKHGQTPSDARATGIRSPRVRGLLAAGAILLAAALVASALLWALSQASPQQAQESGATSQEIPLVVEESPSGWVTGPDGVTRYFDPDTHAYHDGWLDDGDDRYYIDGATGVPAKGWFEVDGLRRFFDGTGRLQTGLVTDDTGTTYYIKPDTGELATHEWVVLDGVFQAFDDDGSMVTLGEVIPPNDAENVANMTTRQRAVVDACDYTPWPGFGLCAAWVSNVFVNAGEPSVGGDACDIARAWCHSSDLSELKPGMVIAVPSHPRTENGKIWGHVCIYAGNGLVRDSGRDSIRWVKLGTWLAWYGVTDTPQWGWANGISLE